MDEQTQNSTQQSQETVAQRLKPSMVIWPILFGLIGVGIMLWREMRGGMPAEPLTLAPHWWLYALLVILCMFCKDYSGMYRLRVMAGVPLNFRQLYRIRMLYEFTSAVTPSVAGGSSLEVLFIHREGIKISRATSMTLLAVFMDELLMIVLFPILLLIIPYSDLFTAEGYFQYGFLWAFIIGYAVKFVWVTILFIGLFFKQKVFTWLIGGLSSIKFLKRYRKRMLTTAVEIKQCAQEIRHQTASYWIKMAFSTIGIWSFRFMIANMAIMIFNSLNGMQNLICFARQYILGIVCTIVPTPGGSGFAEVMFDGFLGEFINQPMSAVVIAFIWRLATYYYYLVAGVVILPQWLGKSKLFKK